MQPDEAVITKNYPNSFLKTDLKKFLDDQGLEEVIIVGAMSHMCINAPRALPRTLATRPSSFTISLM
nr:isochorismatase family protein [Acidovorax sp. D4N7]